jgi:hypothetical protein
MSRRTPLVEKEINGGNPAVLDNDEISSGVSWRLTRATRYPLDPPAIAQFLGLGNWLIPKVRVSSLDCARDAIDLVAATVDAAGLEEHAIFGRLVVVNSFGMPCRSSVRASECQATDFSSSVWHKHLSSRTPLQSE